MPIAVTRAMRADRLRDVAIAAALLLWLAYTRVYWVLQAAHFPTGTCPFFALTGHPCPFCGGTRSFASMWQGDLVAAFRYHPLGPLLFVGTLVAVVVTAALLVTGRSLRLNLAVENRVYLVAGIAFLMAWLFRLALLPLPAT
jgi:Protein of unknown function (DUF2752)